MARTYDLRSREEKGDVPQRALRAIIHSLDFLLLAGALVKDFKSSMTLRGWLSVG